MRWWLSFPFPLSELESKVICLLAVLGPGEDEPGVEGLITEVLDPLDVSAPSSKPRNHSGCDLILALGTGSAAAAVMYVDTEVEGEGAVVAG
jgi:hypothetical protein